MSEYIKKIIKCDICHKETPKNKLIRIKVLSNRILKRNGVSAPYKIDICEDCVDSFERWVRYMDKNCSYQNCDA